MKKMKQIFPWASLALSLCLLIVSIYVPIGATTTNAKAETGISKAANTVTDEGFCESGYCGGSLIECQCWRSNSCSGGYCEVCWFNMGGSQSCVYKGCCDCYQ